MKLLPFALIFMVAGCATSKGNDRAAQHGADQIRMVAVQREARLKKSKRRRRLMKNSTKHWLVLLSLTLIMLLLWLWLWLLSVCLEGSQRE